MSLTFKHGILLELGPSVVAVPIYSRLLKHEDPEVRRAVDLGRSWVDDSCFLTVPPVTKLLEKLLVALHDVRGAERVRETISAYLESPLDAPMVSVAAFMTNVWRLDLGEVVAEYALPPREAVIAAYAQKQGGVEQGDWNTWDYERHYGHLVEETPHGFLLGDYWAMKVTVPTGRRGRMRRNTDDELRALERAALASPDDPVLVERLLVARVRRGDPVTVADVVLAVAQQHRGKAPSIPLLVRRVSNVLARPVGHEEIWRAIDELYERDLVDARGALVDQSRQDVHERVLFTYGDWVVTTRRDDFRESSGSIIGRTRGTGWVAYMNGTFGFDRPEIVPVRVRETLARVVDRKFGERPSSAFLHPVCSGCTTMHKTHMAMWHPDWYDCPNVAIVQARDATVAGIIDALRALEWSPIKIFSKTGEHIGWGVAQPAGVMQPEDGIVWYRVKDRSPEADRSLYRLWLLQRAKAMPIPGLVPPVSAWQKTLNSAWQDSLAREAVERITASR